MNGQEVLNSFRCDYQRVAENEKDVVRFAYSLKNTASVGEGSFAILRTSKVVGRRFYPYGSSRQDLKAKRETHPHLGLIALIGSLRVLGNMDCNSSSEFSIEDPISSDANYFFARVGCAGILHGEQMSVDNVLEHFCSYAAQKNIHIPQAWTPISTVARQ